MGEDTGITVFCDGSRGGRREGRTASDRLIMLGRAASRARQPGSLRAKESSMPRASRVVTSEDPPADTSGSGTPMTGNSPMTAPMLMMAWPMSQAMIPAEAIRHEAVLRPRDEPVAGPGEHAEEDEDQERAGQPQLLTDDGEDEVVVGLREPLHFSLEAPRPTPHQPPSARA